MTDPTKPPFGTVNRRRRNYEVINAHPYPHPTDVIAKLRHTVSVFQGIDDARVAVQATSGTYPADATLDGRDGGLTGLTVGDLRRLLDLIEETAG